MIRLTVPEAPVAKGRARVAVRNGRAHAYTPASTARAELGIRAAVLAAVGPSWRPLSGPLRLDITAHVRMPGTVPKRDRLTARPSRRPDLDNFIKTALDGCSILWRDDAQVVELHATKRYAVDSMPRWDITIEPVT